MGHWLLSKDPHTIPVDEWDDAVDEGLLQQFGCPFLLTMSDDTRSLGLLKPENTFE